MSPLVVGKHGAYMITSLSIAAPIDLRVRNNKEGQQLGGKVIKVV